MVYIKEMVIENFKSFRGRKVIPFQTGFTGITGLNGSGKSNIVDAAQFVMGTRSTRVIRARRLSELVFNGGKKWKPAGFCQVAITFDNRDRELPIDEDEVVFTKKVKITPTNQQGYNAYYYLNGRPSTNGEFDRVLSDAGIFVDGYNVVKQGDVTDITSMTPVERRKILDRVEQIDIYDKNIEKSRDECKEIDANIERMEFICSEKENSLKGVEKEREAALKYQKLSRDRVLQEAKILRKRMMQIEDAIEHYQKQIALFVQETGEIDEAKAKAETILRDVQEQLEEIDKKILEIGGKEAEELKQKIDRIRMRLVALKENNKNDEARILELKGEMQKDGGNRKALEKKKEQLLVATREMEAGLKKSRVEIRDTEARMQHLNELIGKKDNRSLEIQRDIVRGRKDLEELNQKIHQQELQLDRLNQARERLEGEVEELTGNYENASFQITDAEMAIKDLKSRVGTQGETKKELDRTLYDLRNRLMEYRKDLRDVDLKIRSLEREKSVMEAQKQIGKGVADGSYRYAVQAVLDARDRGVLKGVHGTPLELGRVDKKYENAVQVAVGGDFQSIIVEDENAAEAAIRFLKQNNFGRARFLPLSSLARLPTRKPESLLGEPGVVDFVVNFIEFEERFYDAFALICKNTLVVEAFSYAKTYMRQRVRMVTMGGELFEGSGAITGGSISKARKLSFSGSSGQSSSELAQELAKLKAFEENLNRQIARTLEDIDEIERDLGEYKGQIDLNELKDLETRRNQYTARKTALEARLGEKQAELANMVGEFEKLDTSLKELYLRQEQLKLKIKENGDLLLKSADKKLADEINALRETLAQVRELERDLLSQIEVNRTQQELIQKGMEEHQEDITLAKETIARAQKEIEERHSQIESLEAEEHTLVDMEFKISRELEKFRDGKNRLIKKESDLSHKIESLVTKKNTRREMIQDLRFKIPREEEKYQELEEEFNGLVAARGFTTEEAGTLEIPQELEALDYLKRRLKDIERKMKALEPVNMMAITQFDELKERLETIRKEVEEATREKELLLKLIEETVEKKRVRFEKVYSAVNENFKTIFNELSGGEGELILDNPDSVVDSGLEIRAAPMGKNPLRIDFLSGGEKSLTAIAFILAIQNYNPAPFYFFDEADMFLDSANSKNIATTIQKYTRHNQFIMISLKEIVLSQADYFYGVSMYHDGGTTEVFPFISRNEALKIVEEAKTEEKNKKDAGEQKTVDSFEDGKGVSREQGSSGPKGGVLPEP